MSTALVLASLETLPPDDSLYEIVDGLIVEKVMGSREIEIASILVQYMGSFARANKLGRVLSEFLEKVHEYLDAGVSRVWVVYPEQAEVYIYASPTEIQVVRLGQDLEGGDLLPGVRLPLTAIFEDDPE